MRKHPYLYLASLTVVSLSHSPLRALPFSPTQDRKAHPNLHRKRERSKMSSLLDKAKEFVAEKIAHVPMPEATVQGVSFKGVSRECITLHSEVDVNNPYSHRLPICEVSYSLKSADKEIASGTLPDPGWIAATGITKLELPMKVPYDFLISLAKDIGSDWDIDYLLDVWLKIDLPVVGNITIPLSTKGEFKLPTIKDFFT